MVPEVIKLNTDHEVDKISHTTASVDFKASKSVSYTTDFYNFTTTGRWRDQMPSQLLVDHVKIDSQLTADAMHAVQLSINNG